MTVVGLQFGILLGGAILTETVFAWPGIGKWLFDGVVKRDYMVIQGGTLLVASIFVIINLIVDCALRRHQPSNQREVVYGKNNTKDELLGENNKS